MNSCGCGRPIFVIFSVASTPERFKNGGVLKQSQKPSVHHQTLRVLEWDKLCHSVASFTSTSLGREATRAQLWSLNQTYQESLRLLDETNAALEIHKHGGCVMDFSSIDVVLCFQWNDFKENLQLEMFWYKLEEVFLEESLRAILQIFVKSAIQHARRTLPMDGNEALAIVALLQLAETLQLNLKAAIKEDADWYKRFMPISEVIMELVINRSLVRSIQQVVDENGSVKDSASSALKQSRDQVRTLERRLYQLMDSLVRNNANETSSLEVSNVDGRWCLKSGTSLTNLKGLLLSSGSGVGSLIEPLSAVPLNDELQQARALVAKAEADILLKLTEKMQMDLEDIEILLDSVIQLDVINARATYGLSFGGTCPDLFLAENKNGTSEESGSVKREWTLYLPKAYHPLLVQQHRQNLQKARKDVSSAVSELRRKKLQGEKFNVKEETDINISSLEVQVTRLEQSPPVPVDFFIAQRTRVLVITGPNTGGKTICLKTVGLAAMMARSGLHVLASEPVRIPWFDSVFADIGDEQSLSQSLSTFSAHLKQISDIKAQSTNQSLVLLDEVGAGTNPLEGAALGMSLLESFAETGALLTIATTHHSELKTLKYSNNAFENACMEFDEVNLKPTFKILWGIPGRSNAINIAERLGLPEKVLDKARKQYGAASAEINEVIIDMERFKQQFQERVNEAQYYLMLSRDLYGKLLVTKRTLLEHGTNQRFRKTREVSEAAAVARSLLHKKIRQLRSSATQPSQPTATENNQHVSATSKQHTAADINERPSTRVSTHSVEVAQQSRTAGKRRVPKVGDIVHVPSIGKKATVLKVESSKEQLVIQAGNMKLKLKLSDIET